MKGLVLGFSLARAFKGDEEVRLRLRGLLAAEHLLGERGARSLASIVRIGDPDETFLAALIQDVGMIALWKYYDDRYLQVYDLAAGSHDRLAGFEQRHFEVDHAQIGAAMLEGWKFPSHIVDVVLMHHLGTEVAAQDEDMRRIVLLANLVAETLGPDADRAQKALQEYEELASTWFDLRRGTAFAALSSITEHARELGRMFDIESSGRPDVDSILEEADRLRRANRVATPTTDLPENIDGLTGLPDRTAFQKDLLDVFESEVDASILLVGIDGMRELNRAGGPGTGDAALTKVAEAVIRTCREAVGESATVFRFVGAELAVVTAVGTVSARQVGMLAERLRASIRLAPLADERLGLTQAGRVAGYRHAARGNSQSRHAG